VDSQPRIGGTVVGAYGELVVLVGITSV